MEHTGKIYKQCEFCGKTMHVYKCHVERGRGKFCSKECMNQSRMHGSILQCEWCGVKFYRRFGEQKTSELKFCSRECYDTYRFENMKDSTYIKRHGIHEHIIVAENYIGRKLKKGEIVHHIDMDKHNNSPDNLAVIPDKSIHAKVHFAGLDCSAYKLENIKNGLR